jgi:hypothetical protein
MEPIYQNVQSFKPGSNELIPLTVDQIRAQSGHLVNTYSELISKLARLAFANPELVLLLRGQRREYREAGKTTIFPTMYRQPGNGNAMYGYQLKQRYEELRQKEDSLCQLFEYDSTYRNRVGRSELARWAILQHYEVCPTPLLDVTHSALVASSFAFLESSANPAKSYFIYVLGLPQISGSVTVASAQALQVVRLSSVCPPETLRPYFQEGYLMGTYPSVDTLDEKLRYGRDEMDCARRLVAKFRIPTHRRFWDQGFQTLPACAVYPEETSPLIARIKALKSP